MIYNIYLNEELVNSIIADEEFCKNHFSKDGYSYELVQNTNKTQRPLTDSELLRQDLTENDLAIIELGQAITDLELKQMEG